MACLWEPYPPVNGCKKEVVNTSPPQAGHSRRCFARLIDLFTLLPPRLSLSILPFYFTSLSDSVKETGIQTLIRWFYGDPSPPSSRSAGFPNKVVFLASAPRLLFIDLLCSEQSELGLSNKFGLASQEPCCLWLAGPRQGTLGQGPSSCRDHLSWGSSLQNSLKGHQIPQRLAVEARNCFNYESSRSTSQPTWFWKVICSGVHAGNIFPPQFGLFLHRTSQFVWLGYPVGEGNRCWTLPWSWEPVRWFWFWFCVHRCWNLFVLFVLEFVFIFCVLMFSSL